MILAATEEENHEKTQDSSATSPNSESFLPFFCGVDPITAPQKKMGSTKNLPWIFFKPPVNDISA
jgi:hypothetical protein